MIVTKHSIAVINVTLHVFTVYSLQGVRDDLQQIYHHHHYYSGTVDQLYQYLMNQWYCVVVHVETCNLYDNDDNKEACWQSNKVNDIIILYT